MIRRFVLLSLLAVCATRSAAMAQSEALRVYSSNGVKPVLQTLLRPAEAAIARPLLMEFNTTAALRQRINSGEQFDVAVLTAEAIDALIKEGKIEAGSIEVGSAGIGVGVRSGAKKPDIGTPDAMRQTLLNAKSITFAQDGASRPAIEKMITELGITENVKPKTRLVQGSDAANESVASGQSELVLTLVSEIMPAAGVQLVGPLPAKFQSYVRFAVGVSPTTRNVAAARSFVKFLTSANVASTYRDKGIEPAR